MLRIGGFGLLFAFLTFPALPQNKTADLRSRFVRESNPVQQAKLLPQLGDAEFQDIDKDVTAGRLPDALAILEQYRAEAQTCQKSLDAAEIDAEKHSSGFKQLQISLRESLRRLDTFLSGMTSDEQVPFLDVRKDLAEMNRHLIRELFPHGPAANSERSAPEH